MALGAIGAGTGALSAWFDQSYGRATAPAPEEDSRETLNFSDKVKPTPEEAVVRALVAKGLSEANARGYVAISLKDAAGIAGVDLTTL